MNGLSPVARRPEPGLGADVGQPPLTDATTDQDVADPPPDAGPTTPSDTSAQTDLASPTPDTEPLVLVEGCSGPDGDDYTIRITNNSPDRALEIGWNDQACMPIVLGQIGAGKSSNLGTRLNRWVEIRIAPDWHVIRAFHVKTTTSRIMQVP
jgi:hypothetical protein